VLAEGAAGLRAARRLLDDAAAAVAAHDAAVAQVEWARRSDAARWPPGAGVPAGFPLGTVGSGPFARPAPW
jgi:hypothetical protein